MIVSTCSVAGVQPHRMYVASKHAVLDMTRSVVLEYAHRDIGVNAICANVSRTATTAAAEQRAITRRGYSREAPDSEDGIG